MSEFNPSAEMKFKPKLKPKFVVIISVIIGIVMIASAYFELNESKKEIYRVLSEQASSLIKTITLSSVNTLNSSYEIEDLISERLLDNARLIKYLDSLNLLTRQKLITIGNENNLFRINIFNKYGDRVLSNRIPVEGHVHPEVKINRSDEIEPIISGKTKTLILGLRDARNAEGQRYAVAIARARNNGAIVINLDAKDFLTFRKKIGIGKIIQDIGNKSGIEYIILQDSLGILAASKGVRAVNSISEDPFLQKALKSDSVYQRRFYFEGREVYEAVKKLSVDNEIIGLYRIGISLDEIRSVESRMYRRIILTTILLAAIAVIVLSIIFTSQNLKSVSLEYGKFKTFASSVLQNMAEAVIVTDREFIITLFNDSAEKLFQIKRDECLSKNISEFSGGILGFVKNEINKAGSTIFNISTTLNINGRERYLLINVAINADGENENSNYTFVINDYTERKKLEDQAERNEKLAAMGELASGVAHEIRNPINSIGMIAQRLIKEFTPETDKEEYNNITVVLKDEVTRINKIITQFLNYARPLDLKKTVISADEYFAEIFSLFAISARNKQIVFTANNNLHAGINIDPDLMKQALVNIIQNAVDAVKQGGEVSVAVSSGDHDKLKIEIKDNGQGIPEENLKKIFDLYYTTKKDGNGLGLSIAQKIIDQHAGSIDIASRLNKGTTFTIKLPIS